MTTVLRQIFLFVLYGVIGVLLAAIAGAAFYLETRDDLQIWHTVDLKNEYRADLDLENFAEYMVLETALFDELEKKVVDRVEPGGANFLNRYARGSISSIEHWAQDWNRSFELVVDAPRAGAVMLHGMSDSPYSMRSMAERLHQQGVHVVAVRFPGHGTAPSSLTKATWEDMAGATHLAARYLAAKLDGAPLFVFGYSTGGSLAVELSLSAMDDDSLPLPDGLVLFSPAMGLTPLAALTPWQDRLGRLLGFEKFAWNTLEPEYDPFKYRSFPLNAAIQVWRLSNHVDAKLAGFAEAGRLGQMPPVLTFQSVVDSTVSAEALLNSLYARLPEGGHRIVAYDLNRTAGIEALMASDPSPVLNRLLEDESLKFDFSVVTNAGVADDRIMLKPGKHSARGECLLNVQWPRSTYSLAHVALPFAPDDPLYGGPDARPYPGIQIGNVALRGESSALRISPGGLLRQSWNPFFDFQYGELAFFMKLIDSPACPEFRE